jgi:hypothetical protein
VSGFLRPPPPRALQRNVYRSLTRRSRVLEAFHTQIVHRGFVANSLTLNSFM